MVRGLFILLLGIPNQAGTTDSGCQDRLVNLDSTAMARDE